MGKSLDYTLGKGEKTILKTTYSEYDMLPHDYKKHPPLRIHMTIETINCLKLTSQSLMGNTLECGRRSARNIFTCITYLFMCGFPFQPQTLEEMLNFGSKPMKHGTLS
jgi:hypothetical protein